MSARMPAAWKEKPETRQLNCWLDGCLPENGLLARYRARARSMLKAAGVACETPKVAEIRWANADSEFAGAARFDTDWSPSAAHGSGYTRVPLLVIDNFELKPLRVPQRRSSTDSKADAARMQFEKDEGKEPKRVRHRQRADLPPGRYRLPTTLRPDSSPAGLVRTPETTERGRGGARACNPRVRGRAPSQTPFSNYSQ